MKTILLCAAAAIMLSACNTMEGAGTDISHGGQHLHNAAEDAKDDMHHD